MVGRFSRVCCVGLILTAVSTTEQTSAEDVRTKADAVDPEQALLAADEAIRRDPNSPQAYAARARLWMARGSFENARQDFDEAVQRNPTSVFALGQRANFLRGRGELDKALDDYNALVANDPANADAFAGRVEVWFEKVDYERAFRDFDDAVRMAPMSAPICYRRGWAHYRLKHLDKALADFDQAVQIEPSSANFNNARGCIWLLKGDVNKALDDFSAAIFVDPKHAIAYCNRAAIWERKKDWNKALADYTSAIDADPKSVKAYRKRAAILCSKGQLEEAIHDLSELLTLVPHAPHALAKRGELWMQKEDFGKAIADFDAGLRLRPDTPELLVHRGKSRMNNRDVSAALNDFAAAVAVLEYDQPELDAELHKALNEIIRLQPQDGVAFRIRGRFHERRTHDEMRALADYSRAIRRDSNDAEAILLRGELRHSLGQSRLMHRRLRQCDPHQPEAHRRLSAPCGDSEWLLGELDLAFADVGEVLKREPSDTNGYAVRATIFQVQGKFDEAAADYARLIEADTRRYGFSSMNAGRSGSRRGSQNQAVADFLKRTARCAVVRQGISRSRPGVDRSG